MAGQRLTDKTSLANNPASDDLLMVVDVNDTTGSADGTSKKVISEYVIATEKVAVDNTEFMSLATTGKILVQNKGANKIIIPISVYCDYTAGATPNTSTVKPTIGYIDGDSTYYWDQERFAFDSPSYAAQYWIFQGAGRSAKGVSLSSSIADAKLMFYFDAPPSPGSTGVIDLWTTYRLIDIS